MLTTSRAIVLNATRYGDRRLLISMFTREYGKMSFSCTIASGRGRRGKVNFFQPLSLLDLEFDLRPTASVQKVGDVRFALPMVSIPFDAYKLSISLFLSDFMRYALRDEQRNEPLFDYIAQSIEWLDGAREHYSNFHIVFMVKFSKLIGVYPNVDNYFDGAWFDMDEACFVAMPPQHNHVVGPREAMMIPLLSRLSFSTMHLLRMSRRDRNVCTENILQFYSRHLPAFPSLRSFDVLKELFE